MARRLRSWIEEVSGMRQRMTAWPGRRRVPRPEPLPDYGRLYFEHLYGEYRSQPAAKMDSDVKHLADALVAKKQDGTLTWDDLYTFELVLARLAPVEKLPRKVWSLRSRYRDVAGLREYEAYLASKPPDPEGKVEDIVLRADIEYLLGQLYLRYAIMPVRERERTRLSTRVTAITVIGLLVLSVFVYAIAHTNPGEEPSIRILGLRIPLGVTTISVVLFVGAMGGLISMQQRFQSASNEGDLVENVSQLRQGRSSIFLSPVSGAVFAAVLYLVIAAGLLQGELFPKMKHLNGTSDDSLPASLSNFILNVELSGFADYAKLMVWSFLAGFAERLVPDTLSRLVEQGNSRTGGKA